MFQTNSGEACPFPCSELRVPMGSQMCRGKQTHSLCSNSIQLIASDQGSSVQLHKLGHLLWEWHPGCSSLIATATSCSLVSDHFTAIDPKVASSLSWIGLPIATLPHLASRESWNWCWSLHVCCVVLCEEGKFSSLIDKKRQL